LLKIFVLGKIKIQYLYIKAQRTCMKMSKKWSFRIVMVFLLFFTLIVTTYLLYFIHSVKENPFFRTMCENGYKKDGMINYNDSTTGNSGSPVALSNEEIVHNNLRMSMAAEAALPTVPSPAPAPLSNSDRIAALENIIKKYPKL